MKSAVSGLKKAQPYIHNYKGKTFIVKIGGAILADDKAIDNIASQAALLSDLGINIIIVHGGGPQASALSRKLGQEPNIVAGRRVTDDKTLEVAKMVYSGKLNTELVAKLGTYGAKPIGLTGADAALVSATKRPPVIIKDDDGIEREIDFGHVGDIKSIHTDIIESSFKNGFLPVICSLGIDKKGSILNINGDSIAEAIAVELNASKLIFLTSSPGILRNINDDSTLIPFADKSDLEDMMESGIISTGMRPKVEACIRASSKGVKRTHIISGFQEDSLLIELFTGEGCGSMIVGEREKQKYEEELA